jgi:sugar O-acyltransferase (sialic acid O-acetyltransferase NeuD family)
MSESRIVSVPRLGVNDETSKLIEWIIADGESVSAGELLCVLETTKASYDVEAESSGYVVHLVKKDEEVQINQSLAIISPTLKEAQNTKETHELNERKQIDENDQSIKITKKAKDLAIEHGISLEKIISSSLGIIREVDVLNYINKSDSFKKTELNLKIEKNLIPVAIYGASKGGLTVKEAMALGDSYKAVCFLDDDKNCAKSLADLPVFHGDELLELYKKGVRHIATEIMKGSIRQKIKKKVEEIGFELVNVIHPNAFISPSVKMGIGNFIKAGSIIDTNTVIGDCCIIDNGVVIAHDNLIGNGCHIAPGANLGSSIILGQNTVVAIGASISSNINIGNNCILSVGSSIIQDVESHSVIGGVPGKVIGKTK